jgi:hypothetical protein
MNLTQEIISGKLQGPDIFYSGPMLEKSPLSWEIHNKQLPGFTVPINNIEDVDQTVKNLKKPWCFIC